MSFEWDLSLRCRTMDDLYTPVSNNKKIFKGSTAFIMKHFHTKEKLQITFIFEVALLETRFISASRVLFAPHLRVLKSILQIAVPETRDVAHVLLGEPRDPGREIESESQFDQLGGSGEHGGRTVVRRRLFLHISVSHLLEGGVSQSLEKVVQGGVVFQLEEKRTGFSGSVECLDKLAQVIFSVFAYLCNFCSRYFIISVSNDYYLQL